MIAVTGAAGQIGSELLRELRIRFGNDRVLATYHKTPLKEDVLRAGPHVQMDVMELESLRSAVVGYEISVIYHLAAIKSGAGEKDPMRCWDTNMRSLLNVLNLAKELKLRVFWASSVAAFGPATPKVLAPQECYMDPVSIYGISKVSGELLCQYFHHKFGVDVRALRYIGTLTAESLPSGGTSDYALEMFHWALTNPHEPYSCYLHKDTRLPWMHMKDAIHATIQLMSAPSEKISIRTAYNIASVTFTVEELERCIRQRFEHFRVKYPSAEAEVDVRQKIADSIPQALDDAKAKEDWAWKPILDLEGITTEMANRIAEIYQNKKY